MMNKLYYIFFLFILFGCSEETKEKAPDEKPSTILLTQRPVKEQKDQSVEYEGLNASIKQYILKLDSSFDKTPYYTKVDDKFIFYVCKGKWKEPSNGKFGNGEIVMGLIDQNYDTLLPIKYSKIYNPDATIASYIEIESNGKKGLFNYKTKKIIEPQFEVIFPSHKSDYIAFGKIGDEYYGITSESIENYNQDIPTYISLGQKWKFDIRASNIHYLYDSYLTHYSDDPIEGGAVVFTPSYLYHLGFLPEIVEGIGDAHNVEFALTATEGKILKSVSITDKISALISSFYEEGVDARGWQINQNNIITVDANNNVINNEIFLGSPDIGTLYFCGQGMNGFNYLDNNILEVYEVVSSEKDYPKYDYMTKYFYYQIHEDGKIEKLESNRLFDCTKFVVLNENHFKGCFSKHRGGITTINGKEGNLWLYDHLTLEDLDLMRNEIYAEYGLKFKTEKWKEYFSKQSWYIPKYDNVDQFLTEIDKQNIEVILSVKDKMMGKENSITNKRLIMYVPAG